MSRSGYSDDCENWDLIRWRGAVNSAIRGKRGQALLRELAEALDAMPVKELVAHEFEAAGQFCALGCVGARRGIDVSKLDPEDREGTAKAFGIAEALAAEVMYVNDEDYSYWGRWDYHGNPAPKTIADMEAVEKAGRERRWREVRAWVAKQITERETP
jgi:hypothetical protein